MKSTPAPAPRGPDPFTVVHRLVAREPRTRFACGAEFGRHGAGWGDVDCPACLAAPVVVLLTPASTTAPAPTRPRRTLPT